MCVAAPPASTAPPPGDPRGRLASGDLPGGGESSRTGLALADALEEELVPADRLRPGVVVADLERRALPRRDLLLLREAEVHLVERAVLAVHGGRDHHARRGLGPGVDYLTGEHRA